MIINGSSTLTRTVAFGIITKEATMCMGLVLDHYFKKAIIYINFARY